MADNYSVGMDKHRYLKLTDRQLQIMAKKYNPLQNVVAIRNFSAYRWALNMYLRQNPPNLVGAVVHCNYSLASSKTGWTSKQTVFHGNVRRQAGNEQTAALVCRDEPVPSFSQIQTPTVSNFGSNKTF